MPRYNTRHEGSEGEGNWGVLLLGILALLAFAGGGWWLYTRTQENRLKPIAYAVAFDVSQSMNEAERRRCIGVMNELIDSVFAESVRVKIWRYAENLREVADKYPQRSDELTAIYRNGVLQAMGSWGTRPDLPLTEMLQFVQDPQNQNRQIVLCLFTDGENHAPEQTRKIAEKLAQQEKLTAILVGPVKEQYRLTIRKSLEPLGKAQKLILFSPSDTGDAVRQLKSRLQ